MSHTDAEKPKARMRITTMPSPALLEKLSDLPEGYAFLAFDKDGTINMVVASEPDNHLGVLTAQAVMTLLGEQNIAELIETLVRQQQAKKRATSLDLAEDNQPAVA